MTLYCSIHIYIAIVIRADTVNMFTYCSSLQPNAAIARDLPCCMTDAEMIHFPLDGQLPDFTDSLQRKTAHFFFQTLRSPMRMQAHVCRCRTRRMPSTPSAKMTAQPDSTLRRRKRIQKTNDPTEVKPV